MPACLFNPISKIVPNSPVLMLIVGPLPLNFGDQVTKHDASRPEMRLPYIFCVQFWTLKNTLDLDGLSGKVRFTDDGNRDRASANYVIESFSLTDSDTLMVMGSWNHKNATWSWAPNATWIYNGGSTTKVIDRLHSSNECVVAL